MNLPKDSFMKNIQLYNYKIFKWLKLVKWLMVKGSQKLTYVSSFKF